ncbi:MAG: hypothetical protein C0621_06625 [Desulfuromonas sp.]|nr:MAG: hypothetical protein C0621_06625 [Desulfuromonas sp.]
MYHLLNELFEGVYQGLEMAVCAVRENNQTVAQEVVAMKEEVNRRTQAELERQSHSLAQGDGARLDVLNAEFELTDKLKRIYSLSKRIAKYWL